MTIGFCLDCKLDKAILQVLQGCSLFSYPVHQKSNFVTALGETPRFTRHPLLPGKMHKVLMYLRFKAICVSEDLNT